MGKIVIEVDTDAGTATVVETSQGPVTTTPGAPTLQSWSFEGRPEFDGNGVCTADFWMRGKTGCTKGGLYPHWQNYNMIVTMMGGVTEFDVVTAPDPNDPVQMNPSNYNSCVKHAWEVGWCDKPPGWKEIDPDTSGWAQWYENMLKRNGNPTGR